MKKIFGSVLCFVVMFAMFFAINFNVLAARGKVVYISELKMAYGNYSSAEAQLKEKGFTMISTDLNPNCSSSVYLGYKTTSDPNQAITDISVMNMKGGYSLSTYEEFLKQQADIISYTLSPTRDAVNAFRKNYKAGVSASKYAYRMLNNYSYDDVLDANGNPMLLGDFFLNETKCNDDTLATLIMQGNALIMAIIYKCLAVGCYSNTTGSLLSRLSSLGPVNLSEQTSLNPKAEVLKELADDFRTTLVRVVNYDNEIKKVYEEAAGLGNDPSVAVKEYMEKNNYEDSVLTVDTPLLNQLTSFTYGESNLLQFLLDDKKSVIDYYPMASVVTDDEYVAMRLSGMKMLVQFANYDNASWEKMEEENKKLVETDFGTVSVFHGENRDKYKDDIALTNAAMRGSVDDDSWIDKLFCNLTSVSSIVLKSIAGVAATLSLILYFTTPLKKTVSYAVESSKTSYSIYESAIEEKLDDTINSCNSSFDSAVDQQIGDNFVSNPLDYADAAGNLADDADGLLSANTTTESIKRTTITGAGFAVTFALIVFAIVVTLDLYQQTQDYYDLASKYTTMPRMMYDYIESPVKNSFVRYDAVTTCDLNKDG